MKELAWRGASGDTTGGRTPRRGKGEEIICCDAGILTPQTDLLLISKRMERSRKKRSVVWSVFCAGLLPAIPHKVLTPSVVTLVSFFSESSYKIVYRIKRVRRQRGEMEVTVYRKHVPSYCAAHTTLIYCAEWCGRAPPVYRPGYTPAPAAACCNNNQPSSYCFSPALSPHIYVICRVYRLSLSLARFQLLF